MSELDLKRAIDELGDAAWCEGKSYEDWVEPRVNAIAQALDERDALKAELEQYKIRGDNHWETLRSIRDIAKTSGDLKRITQWVDDAGRGYTESVEETMANLMDKTGALIAERDALKAELEKARRALESAGFTLKEGAQEWKPPLGPSASPLLHEIDSLRSELDKAKAMASKAQELAEWHLTHRTFAESQIEEARKQRACGYMVEEAGVTVVYNAACAENLLRHTPVYKRPVPAQQLPDDARYAVDPIYDKGEYYITGAAINEILMSFVSPQTAQQLIFEEVGAIDIRGKHVAASYSFTSELPQGTHTLYIKKQ